MKTPVKVATRVVVAIGLFGRAFSLAPAAAGPAPDATVSLPEFRVETNKDNAYLATESTTGTRMAQKLIDMPYSVQSLPSEFFNDFMLFDIDEMNGFISNVKPADSAGAGNGGSQLRGFGLPNFRNGFAVIQQPDSNNVDRVEVLKGPSSGVYGATSPGGVLNFITKKPKPRPEYTLEYIAGDNAYQRVSGSATGPVARAKNVFYRFDGTYYDFKRPTDFWFNRTLDLSGSVLYKIAPATSVSAEFAFTQRVANPFVVFTRWIDKSNFTQGLVYTIPNDQYPGLGERLTRFNQGGPYNRYERYNNSSYLTFQHRFNAEWSMQANVCYTNRRFRRSGPTSLGNWSLITNNWTLSANPFHQSFWYDQDGAQLDVTGKLSDGAVKQQAHLGGDWTYLGQKFKQWQLSNPAAIQAALPPGTSLAQWQKPSPYDNDFLLRSGVPAFNSAWPMVDSGTNNIFTEDAGLFYNHTVAMLGGRLNFMGTGRLDRYQIHREQPLSTNPRLKDARSTSTYKTYSVGVSYKLIGEKLVPYTSYGTSFNPSPQVDPNTGDLYGNTTARGGEVGVKGLLFSGAFSYTASTFSVRQDNQAVSNPANPGGANPMLPSLAPGGSTRSRGVGIDVSGRLTRHLSVLGNLSWLDARTVKNIAAPTSVGQRVANSGPARSASAAATYAFSDGRLKGLRVGVTYVYSTENVRIYGTANAAGTPTSSAVYLPANSYWGGMISYSWKVRARTEMSLRLAVTDIFSQRVLTDNAFFPTGASWKVSTGLRF